MDILIEKLNGERKKFSELGIIPLDFQVSSTGIERYGTTLQGRPGRIAKGTDHRAKTVTVPFVFVAKNIMKYPEKRDEIFYWLGGVEPFYIHEGVPVSGMYDFEVPGQESIDPLFSGKSEIIYEKRYFVNRTGGFTPEQQNTWGKTSITFETEDLPFAESSVTTMNPESMFYPKWLSDHLGTTPDNLGYDFEGPRTIRVYNGGTEDVDPHYSDIFITYKGASNGLALTNLTNGSSWKYNGTSASGDTITIDRLDSYKNNSSITGDTDLDVLILSPGWNDIEVSGIDAPVFVFLSPYQIINSAVGNEYGTLTFDFRWYWR